VLMIASLAATAWRDRRRRRTEDLITPG